MRILCLLLISVLISCKPKSDLVFSERMLEEVPDSLINPDRMADILIDMQLAEAMLQEAKEDSVRKNKDNILEGYYGAIMEIHGVDQVVFKNSYDYYNAHPLVLHYIHQTMTERLSLMESRYK